MNLRGGTTIGGYLAFHAGNLSSGTSTFIGNYGERTVSHGLGSPPSSATVTPTTNTSGTTGEIWVRWDATNIYVGNSGSSTGSFAWIAIK